MRIPQTCCALAVIAISAGACGDDGQAVDPCLGSETPSASLGQGVGGAFLPYEDEEQVSLAVAPQGGFGVSVIVRTEGLLAGAGLTADVQLNVENGGQLAGEFLQEQTALSCREGVGGEVRGVVVGFDPDVYKSNDDLINLNGNIVELVVTVTDSEARSATVRQRVTLVVGG